MNRFWCGGDIQALKASGIPEMRQHSSDILRIACTSSISSLNRHKFELSFNKSTLFKKKNHIYLCLTRAAIFTVAFAFMMQLGSGTHRTVRSRSGKGGPQMGLLYKMQRTLLWLADADGSERIKHACGWGGSRADTRFNLAPALLALFSIVKDCASDCCFLITKRLQNYRRQRLFYPR